MCNLYLIITKRFAKEETRELQYFSSYSRTATVVNFTTIAILHHASSYTSVRICRLYKMNSAMTETYPQEG